jgi:membrane fusion protein (multidrug efflux system)
VGVIDAELDLSIRQSVIKAPFGGGVNAKLTEVGQWVRLGDPLVEIIATDELEINVDVPEVHFSKIRLNQTAEIRFEALPGVKLHGTVHALSSSADPEDRTFPVKVSVAARNGQVRPGMVAEVTFAPSRPRDVLIAPKDALVERDTGWTVFVSGAGGTVKQTPVRLGESVDAWTEVSGEVSAGDQVVILGNERLRDGQSVDPQFRELPKP